MLHGRTDVNPRVAWELAISAQTKSEYSRRKNCPRDAYLGLCEAGLVSGISPGRYGPRDNINGRHAIDACQILRSEPDILNDKKALWEKIGEPRAKNENGQLDVVVTLWRNRLIR